MKASEDEEPAQREEGRAKQASVVSSTHRGGEPRLIREIPSDALKKKKKRFHVNLNERRAQEIRNTRSPASLQAPDSAGNLRENDKPESN